MRLDRPYGVCLWLRWSFLSWAVGKHWISLMDLSGVPKKRNPGARNMKWYQKSRARWRSSRWEVVFCKNINSRHAPCCVSAASQRLKHVVLTSRMDAMGFKVFKHKLAFMPDRLLWGFCIFQFPHYAVNLNVRRDDANMEIEPPAECDKALRDEDQQSGV